MSNPKDGKNIEIFNEAESKEKTNEQKEKAKKQFEKTENFSYLKKNLESTKEDLGILDKIIATYENLKINKSKIESTTEELSKKYDFSENISIEELTIIEIVENKIGSFLKPKDKLELIRLLSGIEIKESIKNNNQKVDNLEYSKEILNSPNTPIIERLYQEGQITLEDFQIFIKSDNFEKALNGLPKNIIEKIKEDFIDNESKEKSEKNFFTDFYIPIEVKDSFIIKEVAKNYINIGKENKTNQVNKKNITATVEKTLNKLLTKHRYFYKSDLYFKALDFIRKEPTENQELNEILMPKIGALAYIMRAATGENPWRIEEDKNLEAGEQKNAVEKKEEKEKNKDIENSNPIYEKIKKLLDKNNDLGNKKLGEINEKQQQIAELEAADKAANNLDYNNAKGIEWSNIA